MKNCQFRKCVPNMDKRDLDTIVFALILLVSIRRTRFDISRLFIKDDHQQVQLVVFTMPSSFPRFFALLVLTEAPDFTHIFWFLCRV